MNFKYVLDLKENRSKKNRFIFIYYIRLLTDCGCIHHPTWHYLFIGVSRITIVSTKCSIWFSHCWRTFSNISLKKSFTDWGATLCRWPIKTRDRTVHHATKTERHSKYGNRWKIALFMSYLLLCTRTSGREHLLH